MFKERVNQSLKVAGLIDTKTVEEHVGVSHVCLGRKRRHFKDQTRESELEGQVGLKGE